MKKEELKQLIKEEVNNVIKEQSIIDKIKSLFTRTPAETRLIKSLDLFDDNLIFPGEEKFNTVIARAKKFGMDIDRSQASDIIKKKLAMVIGELDKEG